MISSTTLIAAAVALFVAAVARGAKDALQFRFDRSVFAGLPGLFWDPRDSWRNK